MHALRVSSTTDVRELTTIIAQKLRNEGSAELLTEDADSNYIAVVAAALAKDSLAPAGVDVILRPSIAEANNEKSKVPFVVKLLMEIS